MQIKNAFLKNINLAATVSTYILSKTTYLSFLLKAEAGGQDGALPTRILRVYNK